MPPPAVGAKKKAYGKEPELLTIIAQCAVNMDLAGAIITRKQTRCIQDIHETLSQSDDPVRCSW